MVRRLLGFNKTFTVRRKRRVVTASGSIDEATTEIVATGVPGAIQPHLLNNLPPPGERPYEGGLLRKDEYRIWIGDESVADIKLDDLLVEEGTSPAKVYRILAVVDDAGRGHHQLFRAESYSQESLEWIGEDA